MRKNKRIVVVDDSEELRFLLKKILIREGYEVIAIESAIKLAAEDFCIDGIDLILLDVQMQWISGFDICRSLRQNSRFKTTKIFFLTARDSEEDIAEGFAAGADDFIIKPFEIDVLLDRITAAIGNN